MFAPTGVGILVAGRAVVHVKAEGILRKMGRHPVHDHADSGLMALVHKVHKVLGGAVTAGGCKISGYLIAPAPIEGVLGHRQQLHMGVAHVLQIRNQLIRQLGIVVGISVFLHLPAARVQLVDVHGAVDGIRLFLPGFPLIVLPLVPVQVVHLAAVGRPGLRMERIGIRLKQKFVTRGGDAVLVHIIFLNPRNECFPDAGVLQLLHGMTSRYPAVEIAYDAHRFRVGGPGAEHDPLPVSLPFHVGAEEPVSLKIVALLKQIYG